MGFGFISLGHIDRRFLSFFSKQGLQRCNCFFAGDGYADSHISTASTSHRGEDLCSLLQCPPHPTPSCIQRSNTTRHLCSVATCSGRSTRNVNMAPPHPTPPLHDLRTHASKNARFTRERERGMLGWSSVGLQGGPMVDSLVDSQDVTLGENWGRYHHVPPKIRCWNTEDCEKLGFPGPFDLYYQVSAYYDTCCFTACLVVEIGPTRSHPKTTRKIPPLISPSSSSSPSSSQSQYLHVWTHQEIIWISLVAIHMCIYIYIIHILSKKYSPSNLLHTFALILRPYTMPHG